MRIAALLVGSLVTLRWSLCQSDIVWKAVTPAPLTRRRTLQIQPVSDSSDYSRARVFCTGLHWVGRGNTPGCSNIIHAAASPPVKSKRRLQLCEHASHRVALITRVCVLSDFYGTQTSDIISELLNIRSRKELKGTFAGRTVALIMHQYHTEVHLDDIIIIIKLIMIICSPKANVASLWPIHV